MGVADLDDEYKMEDILDAYERPYNPQEPVICVDKKPITLHAELRPALPAVPGREARWAMNMNVGTAMFSVL